jgi:hypothetical protein
MTSPQHPAGPSQQNQGHQVYAAQGGNQYFNHTNIYTGPGQPQQPPPPAPAPRTGRTLVVMLAVHVVFFIYGAVVYTGQVNNPADLGRAMIFLILLGTTGTLLRRWVRNRF